MPLFGHLLSWVLSFLDIDLGDHYAGPFIYRSWHIYAGSQVLYIDPGTFTQALLKGFTLLGTLHRFYI